MVRRTAQRCCDIGEEVYLLLWMGVGVVLVVSSKYAVQTDRKCGPWDMVHGYVARGTVPCCADQQAERGGRLPCYKRPAIVLC